MTSNEPDAVTWQRLFASLVGDAAVDAATIREFCSIHGLTPDRVLSHSNRSRQPLPLAYWGAEGEWGKFENFCGPRLRRDQGAS